MNMDADELRWQSISLAIFSTTALLLFVVLYWPLGYAQGVGASIRPMRVHSILITLAAMGGWIPVLVLGVRQLCHKPRRFGAITIIVGLLHLTGFMLPSWVLIDLRGHHWGT